MYDGYFTFAGTEIANTGRTVAYARDNGLSWLRDCAECPDLHQVLGEKEYTSPLIDQPAWFDPDDVDTWNFYGFYPTSITGVSDSTRTATVTEGIGDGGSVSGVRRTTRTIQVTGLLIAADGCAAEAGLEWLKFALDGSACHNPATGCNGNDMCFYSCCPPVCEDTPDGLPADVTECGVPYERRLVNVTCTAGPTIISRPDMSCGALIEVEFTLVAGVPWVYGSPVSIIEGALPDASRHRYRNPEVDVHAEIIPDEPDDLCVDDSWSMLIDPNCPAVPTPPTVPSIPAACIEDPANWLRYSTIIPADLVPTWADAVPDIVINTGTRAIRQVRIRFYSNPLEFETTENIDACAYCGEFIISYIPPNSTMHICGLTEQVTVTTPGDNVFSASHLISGTGGGPFEWPLLTCGHSYIMTADVVPTIARDVEFSVDLVRRVIG